MVVSPRCLERGPSSTPSHHQCEGRPPPKTTARRAPSNSAVASAVGLGGLGARYPIYGSAVIARSASDDPSTLAAQATPGWESAEALCAKAEAIQLSLQQSWIASRSLSSGARSRDPLARNDGVDGPRRHRCARLVMSIRPDKGAVHGRD